VPWSPSESNLSLFQVSDWFIEDTSNFGGIFAVFPLLFAWLAAASETIGALFLVLGFKTRLASFFLMITMLVAIFFQQWNNGLWAMLPAIGFLWVTLYSLVLGSGRLGIDYIIFKKMKNDSILMTTISQVNIKSKSVIAVILLSVMFSCNAQQRSVTLKVDTKNLGEVNRVAVRGNIKPLSQSKDFELTDVDKDGIYEATISFKTSKPNVKFKFLVNGQTELEGSDSRVLWFKDEPVIGDYSYNEFNYYDQDKIEKLVFTDSQIDEDIAVLKKIIQFVHPNVYKFRDSLKLQNDFELLETEMKSNPTLINAYGAVSKFASKIKCSHTFTNPWNQSSLLEKANFYQHDKIPFTFNH